MNRECPKRVREPHETRLEQKRKKESEQFKQQIGAKRGKRIDESTAKYTSNFEHTV